MLTPESTCGRCLGCRRAGCPRQVLLPCTRRCFGCRPPSPRWDGAGGSWPDSQRGGGQGQGGGGVGLLFAASLFLAGAGTGTTNSSRVRLAAGSPSWPPCARSAMSFLAAILLTFEVRCMPSPAQMLAPSTVVRSWGRDSREPKKLKMLISLAVPVRSPAAAASARLFLLRRTRQRVLRTGGLTHGCRLCSRQIVHT